MRKKPPINRLVSEMPKRKAGHSQDSPKQCPCGHKHISWTVDDNDVYCWDCNKQYPLSECSSSRASASSIIRIKEQLPLFKSDSQPANGKDELYSTEKRRHPRVEVTCPVIVEKSVGLFMNGKTKDISCGGAFITCWEPLEPNAIFQIEFSGAHLDHRMKATAEVIWSKASGSDEEIESRGMGVRFTEISQEARTVISGLLADLSNTEHAEEPLRT
jgi:hypothetical protein